MSERAPPNTGTPPLRPDARAVPSLHGRAGPYAYYVVAVLTIAYMFSFMDRVVIGLMIEPIKRDLSLSETQIGVLVGFSFVLSYIVMSLPWGIAADRFNRRNLLVLGLGIWCLATAGCGVTSSFGGLLVARALVGGGEAVLAPVVYTAIADRFPKERLGFAMGLYSIGVSIGSGAALIFGGTLVEAASNAHIVLPFVGALSGWRLSFIALGLTGLPLMAVILFTVDEPARRPAASAGGDRLSELAQHLRRHAGAYAGVFGGFSVLMIAAYLPMIWAPRLFMMRFADDAATIGMALGTSIAVAGTIGLLLGGRVSDRLARAGVPDAPIRVVLWSQIAQVPVWWAAYAWPTYGVAVALFSVGMLLSLLMGGLQAVALRLITPERMRGRVTAIYMIFVNFAGLGVGSLAIGALNDHVFGTTGMRWSMIATATASLLSSSLTFWLAGPAIRRAVHAQSSREAASPSTRAVQS